MMRARLTWLVACAAVVSVTPGAGSAGNPHPHPSPLGISGFRMIGSPSIPAIDNAMYAVMKGGNVPGASLAIVDGTRLVYAKGYALHSSQVVRPITYFRQASVSKFITSLAIMQLVDAGKLTLDTTMQSVLEAHPPWGGAPKDSRFGKITIRNLLEMDSGLDPALEVSDVAVAGRMAHKLPVDVNDLESYAASETLQYAPGDKSQAAYNDSNFDFLAYIVTKLRGGSSFAAAIRKPLLEPLGIKRIRGAQPLKSQQLKGEAVYYPDPPPSPQTAKSVMTQSQPTVEIGYGDENFRNMQGGGGMSAAATDLARLLAAMNYGVGNPAFSQANLATWMSDAHAALNDSAFSGPNAFGFFGFDALGPIPPSSSTPPYEGDKGGYLETSQNAIYFQSGGIGYVLCFNRHTQNSGVWYPAFSAVITAAEKQDWGTTDLFPKYGMPTFTRFRIPPYHGILPFSTGLRRIDPLKLYVRH